MRFRCRKFLILLFLFLISLLTWNILSRQVGKNFEQTCNQIRQYQDELHIFTDRVHRILTILNVTHFLCYGSLWGQIRLSRLLPWEDKSVLCLLNEDILKKDELMVALTFRRENFYLSYDNTDGEYIVTRLRGDENMRVILRMFEMDKLVHMYRRIGWMRRILPPACEALETLDCFPPRLITPPLEMKEFGGYLIPVPRETIEIQKYHFKNDWWREIPIKNC